MSYGGINMGGVNLTPPPAPTDDSPAVAGALSPEEYADIFEHVPNKTEMQIAREEMQSRVGALSTAQLKQILYTNRALYATECTLGAVTTAAADIAQQVPLVSMFPSLYWMLAEDISNNHRATYADKHVGHTVTTLMTGGLLGAAWDIVEGTATTVTRLATASPDKSKAYQFTTARATLAIMAANYTRLVGRNSACGRALTRAAVPHEELLHRATAVAHMSKLSR